MNRVFKREKEKRENLRDAGFLQSPHPGAKSSQPHLDTIEWEKVKNELRLQMTAAVFDTWVKQTTAHRHGDTLVITPRNRFAYEWLNMRLRPTIAKTVKQICGRHTTIDFVNPADAGEQEPQGPAYGERE